MRFISLCAWALYVTCVFLFIAGYAARYVPARGLWWVQVAGIGLPYLSALIVAMTVAAAVSASRALLITQLALCGLIAVRFASHPGLKGERGTSSETLTVMTMNASFQPAGSTSTGHAAGAAVRTVEELLGRERPQLVALQEAGIRFSDGTPEEIMFAPAHIARPAESLDYRVDRPDVLFEMQLRQPVFSRVQVERVDQIPIAEGAKGAPPTTVTRVHFRWQGREAVLYNVHLHSFLAKPWRWSAAAWRDPAVLLDQIRALRTDFLIRAREAERLRDLLDEETRPFIVCGDFNSTPHNWVYAHVAEGLDDAFETAGTGWGATYHARLPFVRIDYVLVSPEWKVLSSRVPARSVSDHRAVIARLTLREQE